MATLKNLTYTKSEYENLIATIRKNLATAVKDNEMNLQQRAEIFGLFYNACAGLIRSGALHKKEMSDDGYAQMHIVYKDKEVKCKDSAIRDIFKDEYKDIIHPYEDNSAVYIHPYQDVLDETVSKITSENSAEKTFITQEDIINIDKKTSKPSLNINLDLTDIAEKNAEAKILRAEAAVKREENRDLLKSLKGTEYDPNYDHYYSEELPKILEDIDTLSKDSLIKGFCILMSFVGIIVSLLFI